LTARSALLSLLGIDPTKGRCTPSDWRRVSRDSGFGCPPGPSLQALLSSRPLIERDHAACNRSAGGTGPGASMVTHPSPSTSLPAEADVTVAARRLVPQVRALRDECERLRRVPTAMAEALAEAGLLQMYLPRSMGAPELPPLVVFRAVEEISRADGSIGWGALRHGRLGLDEEARTRGRPG